MMVVLFHRGEILKYPQQINEHVGYARHYDRVESTIV